MLAVDKKLREHISRRGELVTLLVLILKTVDLKNIPLLEISSDVQELAATTVKVPLSLHAKLKQIARQRKISMNALVNSAVWAYEPQDKAADEE
jgi:hypothetical protein